MGYHHCHLPSVEQLQSELDIIGLNQFVKKYTKYETIIGETDRIKFIEDKIELLVSEKDK